MSSGENKVGKCGKWVVTQFLDGLDHWYSGLCREGSEVVIARDVLPEQLQAQADRMNAAESAMRERRLALEEGLLTVGPVVYRGDSHVTTCDSDGWHRDRGTHSGDGFGVRLSCRCREWAGGCPNAKRLAARSDSQQAEQEQGR